MARTNDASNSAEVVSTDDLRAVLVRERNRWNARLNRDENEGGAHRGSGMEGFLNHLVRESEVPARRIYGIFQGESKWTSLEVADAILIALDLPHALGTEIHAVPNPRWTNEHYLRYMQSRGCA